LRELEVILFAGDENSKIAKQLRRKMTEEKLEEQKAADRAVKAD